MILRGFTIENWGCIEQVAIEDLPATGLVVLHGPNGTGKSSIIEALRACLFEYKSSSKAKKDSLRRAIPKNSDLKPKVAVTFAADGKTWRITKQFGTDESRLEEQAGAETWRLVTADPTAAHERTCQLAGSGNDGKGGLQQLLWLTQAEFNLPAAKDFDPNLQAQLRSILGVLQTPLDDRFHTLLTRDWEKWFSRRGKPGTKPTPKKGSDLERASADLEVQRRQLQSSIAEAKSLENLLSDLEVLRRRGQQLERTRAEQKRVYEAIRAEQLQCEARIQAFELARTRRANADNRVQELRQREQSRKTKDQELHANEVELREAKATADSLTAAVRAAETELADVKQQLDLISESRRKVEKGLAAVAECREQMQQQQKLDQLCNQYQQAKELATRLAELQQRERDRPAPEAPLLAKIETWFRRRGTLRAELQAAALDLSIRREPGGAAPELVIDGEAVRTDSASSDENHKVRRQADITIPGWGHLSFKRGSDARSLDQIDCELAAVERELAEALAPFGVFLAAEDALEQLRRQVTARAVLLPELQRCAAELAQMAPAGLEELRLESEKQRQHVHARTQLTEGDPYIVRLRADSHFLEQETERLKAEKVDIERHDAGPRARMVELENMLARTGKGGSGTRTASAAAGLREQEQRARERFYGLEAKLEHRREELDQLAALGTIQEELAAALAELQVAEKEFDQAKLSESEQSLQQRLIAAKRDLEGTEARLVESRKQQHQIEGQLLSKEGFHQRQATEEARVRELEQHVNRLTLERDAIARLHSLFEECREKQFGTVLQPLHDRLVGWMRLLRIPRHDSVRFNDQFLPEALVAQSTATELSLQEESIGTIEQLGLMVRLALGGTLATAAEPAVAVLDDPLTHSDVLRLERMAAVLRSAAAGDPMSKPPAGPLQILIFTCHPEWFEDADTHTIDLPRVLRRST